MIERERPKRPPFISPRLLVGGATGAVLVVLLIVFMALWSTVASVEVPDVLGLLEPEATASLLEAGLRVEIAERVFDSAPAGTVLSQTPAPGESVPEDSVITLKVSAGTEEFELPDVMGLALRSAQAQLEARGLTLRIDYVDAEAPTDTVIASNPSPGALVRTGDIVRLTVAAESNTTSDLVPFNLDGSTVVLDPVPIDAIDGDPTLEMARKLRSLLEASGAQVQVTRSLTAGDTSDEARAAVATGTADVVVIIDITSRNQAGMMVRAIDRTTAPRTHDIAVAMAESIASALADAGYRPGRGEVPADAVSSAIDSPSVRVTLGSTTVASDVAAFVDPAWTDTIARALYLGIGAKTDETLRSR
jgi:hypothetical protein